jgi:hypothetical protein
MTVQRRSRFATVYWESFKPGEQVFYVVEGQVNEPTGGGATDFNLYIGALIVTNQRLLVGESKMMGGAKFASLLWADVEQIGRRQDGSVAYKKTLRQGVRWPLWIATAWVGKSYKTPVDLKALDVLEMSSREAFDAVHQAALSARVDDAASAYEELKRRREQG